MFEKTDLCQTVKRGLRGIAGNAAGCTDTKKEFILPEAANGLS